MTTTDCTICAGTGTTFGKRCTCVPGSQVHPDQALASIPCASAQRPEGDLIGLTDERIERMARAACFDASRLSTIIDFARAIESEVLSTANAAQAGVREQAIEEVALALEQQHTWISNVAAANVARALKSTPSTSVNSKEGGK